MPNTQHLTKWDTIVEAYESEDLLERIQRILNERGVLTAAEYQHELQEARTAAAKTSAGYGEQRR